MHCVVPSSMHKAIIRIQSVVNPHLTLGTAAKFSEKELLNIPRQAILLSTNSIVFQYSEPSFHLSVIQRDFALEFPFEAQPRTQKFVFTHFRPGSNGTRRSHRTQLHSPRFLSKEVWQTVLTLWFCGPHMIVQMWHIHYIY